MTCPNCHQPLVDGGQSGSYCDTPGCGGNYYGGNRDREDEEAYLTYLLFQAPSGSWRAAIDYRSSLPPEERMGRWWERYPGRGSWPHPGPGEPIMGTEADD